MAEDIVALHPLLMTKAVLSGKLLIILPLKILYFIVLK
jgi:hypothetical protein